ncbi:MAG TPA: hypothetical protein VGQ30_11705 [Gemmatimonadaceae bacterium]|nr:hypothetical protein [Gemmatimonadaceae bacterium]
MTNSGDESEPSIVMPAGAALELTPADATPPRLEPAQPIEGAALAARAAGEPVIAFAAFLDGVQTSRALYSEGDSTPLVHGTVAAVVRQRVDRALRTWRGSPLISRAFYAPVAMLRPRLIERFRAAHIEIEDTLEKTDAAAARHPMELLALARTAVQRRRELLEVSLAESWCDSEAEPLFVDGGISGAGRASHSALAVGVVKSHRTLYSTAESLGVITALDTGYRTTAFEIRSPRRTTVASWYLRLRDARGRDPFFGLVRVEVARDSWSPGRADEVSRWVLAERAPVSLPDKRWSSMAYGIRDCEEYLRALMGA